MQPQLPHSNHTHACIENAEMAYPDRGAEGTPTHREGHRRARPTATVLLHPSQPPDNVKNTESEGTQRAGATLLPPLDITLACAGTSKPAARLHTPDSLQGLPPR
jgi:hypothetical protein